MSISPYNGCRELINRAMQITGKPLPDLHIMELGNQRIKTDPQSGMKRLQSSKSIFEFFGADYVCVDINGVRSHQHDLRHPIEVPEWYGRFDIVTNFGTSEHVSGNQESVFSNMHRMAKLDGGLLVHSVPSTRQALKHGTWKYSPEWFTAMAAAQRYEVLYLDELDLSERFTDGRFRVGENIYTQVIMRRSIGGWNTDGWQEPVHRRGAIR